MATPLPLPPSGTPVFNPETGAMSPVWQNYFLELETALSPGIPPIDATYWVSTANAALTSERDIGALASGYLQIVTGGGIAVPSTVPQIPATDLSGILPVASGGTGDSSFTDHGVLVGSGTDPVSVTAVGSAGQVLTSNGAGLDPTFQAPGGSPGGSDTQVQFNDSGAFGGDAGLTYNKTTDALTLAGLLNISGAAAGQIQFPASQNASSNANTLDDYEEGTWTPSITGDAGSGATYGSQAGIYVKVGTAVLASFNLTLTSLGTLSGNLSVAGFPFTSSAGYSNPAPGATIGWAGTTTAFVMVSMRISPSVTAFRVFHLTAAATSSQANATTIANLSSVTSLNSVLAYQAAA